MFLEKKIFKVFCLIFISLLFVLLLLVNTLKNLEYNFFDFNLIKNKQLISTKGLSRSSVQSIKMAYIEGRKKVDLGLFGNHIIQYHTKDVLDPNTDFFNFWYANLSLTEIHHLLIYLDNIDKLPEKILIGITTPNNDNGGSIIRYRGELSSKYISGDKIFKDLNNNITEFTSFILNHFSLKKFFKNIDYINLYQILYDFYQKKKIPLQVVEDRLIEIEDCRISKKINENKCFYSLRYDGTLSLEFSPSRSLVKGGEIDDKSPIQLKKGDSKIIAYQIQSINNFLKEKNKKVIFFIPPVYEGNKKTLADTLFDEGLKKVDNKKVIILDHRYLRNKKDYFVHFDHTNKQYFKFLINEINDKFNF